MQFKRSFTPEEVKQEQQGAPLEVVKNPHTNKLFWTCGAQRGPVSTNYQPGDRPAITECVGDEGEVFFLLHSASSQNVVFSL